MAITDGLGLPGGVQPPNPVPVDSWSGPFDTVAEANAAIPAGVRFQTMGVRIIDGGDGKMFWYKDGIADMDLIEFQSSGGASDTDAVTNLSSVTGTTASDALEHLDSDKIETSEKGAANGVVPLNGSQKIDPIYLDVSGLTYQGNWNASTNTPTLGDSGAGGVNGDYYIVSVAGATSVDGITDWEVGDWIINNGSNWQKIDQTNTVNSVFGRTGVISSQNGDYTASQVTNAFDKTADDTGDVPEGTNLYYTEGRVTANASVAANTVHRGLTTNPHGVTATQVGLGNVDNTADADKPLSTADIAEHLTKMDAGGFQITAPTADAGVSYIGVNANVNYDGSSPIIALVNFGNAVSCAAMNNASQLNLNSTGLIDLKDELGNDLTGASVTENKPYLIIQDTEANEYRIQGVFNLVENITHAGGDLTLDLKSGAKTHFNVTVNGNITNFDWINGVEGQTIEINFILADTSTFNITFTAARFQFILDNTPQLTEANAFAFTGVSDNFSCLITQGRMRVAESSTWVNN